MAYGRFRRFTGRRGRYGSPRRSSRRARRVFRGRSYGMRRRATRLRAGIRY